MLGCVLTLALLAAIVIRCIVVARNAKSQLDAYICVGVAGMLVFQIVSNVGMCLFVLPVVGLTLPFISYGGSSVVTLFIAMGMVSASRSAPCRTGCVSCIELFQNRPMGRFFVVENFPARL